MFTKLRKYLANKIYNQRSLIEAQSNYIKLLHDSLYNSNKCAQAICNAVIDNNEKINKIINK